MKICTTGGHFDDWHKANAFKQRRILLNTWFVFKGRIFNS